MNKETEPKQLRSFGLMVGGIFVLIAVWPTFFRGEAPRLWALSLAGLLVLPALVAPRSLRTIYQVWMALGHALGWINTRIILGVVLYGLFTPMGLVRRFLFGKDSMHRRFDRVANTYRVVRRPRPRLHMTRQF